MTTATQTISATTNNVDSGATNISFAQHVNKHMVAEHQEPKNLLGVKEDQNREKLNIQNNPDPTKTLQTTKQTENISTAELLNQFIQDLQKITAETEKTASGDWQINLADDHLLQQLATNAGIEQSRLSVLVKQAQANSGQLDLTEFLTFLSRHFEELQSEKPITVPETALPLFEIFLKEMGFAPYEITKIGNKAVTGDNQLDLIKFLQALPEINNKQVITLSNWEGEQLQDILAKMGVSPQLQRELLPERNPLLNLHAEKPTVTLTMTRLKEMLQQGVREIEANRPQADLIPFIADLKKILTAAGFKEKTVGFSPVVQNTIKALYDKLMKSVDLTKVQVETKSNHLSTIPNEKQENSGRWFEGFEGSEKQSLADFFKRIDRKLAQDDFHNYSQLLTEEVQSSTKVSGQTVVQSAETALIHNITGLTTEPIIPVDTIKHMAATPRLSPQMEHQLFHQLAQGVIKGLKNSDHLLILRLQPPELGQVKVEMMVRGREVMLSFIMENSRVKETLENNLEQFRHNLEKQGFKLQNCMVSVNQHDNPTDTWRRFEFALHNKKQSNNRTTITDLPDDAMYHRSLSGNSSEHGIDLFA